MPPHSPARRQHAKNVAASQTMRDKRPIAAPFHGLFTSPARSHAHSGHGKELPLHLIQLILEYLDDVADLARVTRTSRLFYYMTLPRLYERVTLRAYSEIRYVDGRPEGYGSGSPFAMGLNTLVSRNFCDYIHVFRLIGDWREHDVEDYAQGRVPDNSMMLQVALRAAIDKMHNLRTFAWELSTKPLNTVYQSLMNKPSLTKLVLRCQTRRIPRPTTLVPPIAQLTTLVLYDIDPLCYPDDVSLLILSAKQLENIKMHFNPRMRESGEESVNLLNFFGRCIGSKHAVPVKRVALYNLYTRNPGDGFEHATDHSKMEEMTFFNCMGSSTDPMTVFLDDTWRLNARRPIPRNLKMMRCDVADREHVKFLASFTGLQRLYLVMPGKSSKPVSSAATPTTPMSTTPHTSNGVNSATGTPKTSMECKSLASDYLATIQANHGGMRHLLLPDQWQLSDETLFKLFQTCSDLEQVGFYFGGTPFESLRQIVALTPKLWALRLLVRPGTELAEKMDSMEDEVHQFALATELWRPEYQHLRYVGCGDRLIFKLGRVVFPPKNAPAPAPGQDSTMDSKQLGPLRSMERVSREQVQHVEIWGLDSAEFVADFP